MTDTSGPAFPRPLSVNLNNGEIFWEQEGLTKRELFAAMAMQGLLASNYPEEAVTEAAIHQADALLAELKEKPSA